MPHCPFCGNDGEQEVVLAIPGEYERLLAEIQAGRKPGDEVSAYNTRVPPTASVSEDVGVADTLIKQCDIHAAAGDYAGVGNLIIEALMRPGQEEYPDSGSGAVAKKVQEVVALRFNLPELLTFAYPHSDEFLPHDKRNDWKADTFPLLIIFAFLLGATRRNLPPPHDRLVPYYRLLAQKQNDSIIEALNAYQASGKAEAERQRMAVDRERWEAERTAKEEAERKLREREERLRADLDTLKTRAAKENMDRHIYEEQVAAIREHYRQEK